MLVLPVADPGLGNTSYVVDLGDGSALVVDPERDPRPYLSVADGLGLVIRHVAETHLHADFVSGSRELVAMGASLLAPRDSRLGHHHLAVGDGDEVRVGDLTLSALATPGHTPEHVAYVLSDGPTPMVVFTGGTLMAGGVARPDLISPELTVPLAHDAFRSVRRLLEVLPSEVEVRPTHGGGSFCSTGAVSAGGVSTVGSERRSHPAITASTEEAFVADLLSGLGTYPDYFRRLRPINQAGPEVIGVDLPVLRPVSPDDVHDPVVVVDARPIARFADGHVPGSISNELRGQFGTWLGWLFEPDTPIVFVLDPDQDERELIRQSLNVGHEAIVGRLDVTAWTATGGTLDTIPLISPGDIPADGAIVDVRQLSEWEAGHVPGAVHLELGEITGGATGMDGAVVHCGHGQRAMTAASLLRRRGLESISVTPAEPAEIAGLLASR